MLAQYCRYCTGLMVGDQPWCTKKQKEIAERLAKTTNYCPLYDLNPMDAFGENEKGYQPRNKKPEEYQCDGQMSLEDIYKMENIDSSRKCSKGS